MDNLPKKTDLQDFIFRWLFKTANPKFLDIIAFCTIIFLVVYWVIDTFFLLLDPILLEEVLFPIALIAIEYLRTRAHQKELE